MIGTTHASARKMLWDRSSAGCTGRSVANPGSVDLKDESLEVPSLLAVAQVRREANVIRRAIAEAIGAIESYAALRSRDAPLDRTRPDTEEIRAQLGELFEPFVLAFRGCETMMDNRGDNLCAPTRRLTGDLVALALIVERHFGDGATFHPEIVDLLSRNAAERDRDVVQMEDQFVYSVLAFTIGADGNGRTQFSNAPIKPRNRTNWDAP